MPRKSSKRKSKKKKKRSKGKRNHAYEIVKPSARLVSSPLVGLLQLKGDTVLNVILLAVLVLLISQFFITDRFYVYEFEVRGNQFVSRDELWTASDLNGWNIFWIKPDQVEVAISSLPGIKEAKVTCRLPNRVRIEVEERRVQIIWQRGEARYSVDDQGSISPLEGESEGMLLIQDLTDPLEADDQIKPEVVRSALELRQLLAETAVLQYSENKGLILHQEGYPVYLGTGDMVEKVAILNALLRDFAFEGIQPEFVDVRFIESPYYRY